MCSWIVLNFFSKSFHHILTNFVFIIPIPSPLGTLDRPAAGHHGASPARGRLHGILHLRRPALHVGHPSSVLSLAEALATTSSESSVSGEGDLHSSKITIQFFFYWQSPFSVDWRGGRGANDVAGVRARLRRPAEAPRHSPGHCHGDARPSRRGSWRQQQSSR